MQPSFISQTVSSVFGTLYLNIIVSAPSVYAFKNRLFQLELTFMWFLCEILGFSFSHLLVVLFTVCGLTDSVRALLVVLSSMNKQIN